MKKPEGTKREPQGTSAPPPRDEQAHRAAVRGLHEQAERLGLLDAFEAEPALIFVAREEPQ